jgi:hypothetical protein
VKLYKQRMYPQRARARPVPAIRASSNVKGGTTVDTARLEAAIRQTKQRVKNHVRSCIGQQNSECDAELRFIQMESAAGSVCRRWLENSGGSFGKI